MFKIDRLSAFSDGVMAIAITLLVLGLEVPSVHEVPAQQLSKYLVESFHPVLGYVSSFVLIGTYWLQHYAIFHYISHANRTLVALNGLFLLCVSFVAFPTGLQAAYRHDELAIIVFGGTHVACGLSLLALWIYATSQHRLVEGQVSPQVIKSMNRRIALTPVISIVAIGVSFISIELSKIIFLAIPLIYFSHRTVDTGWVPPEDADPASNE